jgi:hypothetical protein
MFLCQYFFSFFFGMNKRGGERRCDIQLGVLFLTFPGEDILFPTGMDFWGRYSYGESRFTCKASGYGKNIFYEKIFSIYPVELACGILNSSG